MAESEMVLPSYLNFVYLLYTKGFGTICISVIYGWYLQKSLCFYQEIGTLKLSIFSFYTKNLTPL